MYKFYFKKSKRAIKQLRLALCYFSNVAAVFLWLSLIPGRAGPGGQQLHLLGPNNCFHFCYGELITLNSGYLQLPLIWLLWLNVFFHHIFIEFFLYTQQSLLWAQKLQGWSQMRSLAPRRLYILMWERPWRRKPVIKIASQSSTAIKTKVMYETESLCGRNVLMHRYYVK